MILLLVAVLAGLIWLGRPSSTLSEPKQNVTTVIAETSLIPDKVFHDFGTISMKNGKVSTVYILTNNSDSVIKTSKLFTSCMCTSAKFVQAGKESDEFGMPGHGFVPSMERSIAPGESVQIVATFDPAAHGPAGVGVIERVVRLETDAGATELNFRANVIP